MQINKTIKLNAVSMVRPHCPHKTLPQNNYTQKVEE